MRTSPATSERLTTRAKPCRPYASDTGGSRCTRCTPPDSCAGTVERFVRWPVGLDSRLITHTGTEVSISSRHLPTPSPSDPSRPTATPDSSSADVIVLASPGATSSVTPAPGNTPASSVPRMVTAAGSSPGLTNRSQLSWLALLAGLKVATRYLPTSTGAVSCISHSAPSGVRAKAWGSMSSSLVSLSRQSPTPGPVLPVRPWSAPASRLSALRCTVSLAPTTRVNSRDALPASSTATMITIPASSELLMIRTTP